MTATRLTFIPCIATRIVDYKTNDGRLKTSLGDAAAQWGIWLYDQLARLTRQIAPPR
jgi:hypothetical protein